MNIDDVKENIPEDFDWVSVFETQAELIKHYHLIEKREGLPNLDTKTGQAVVKDFLWRITEEIGEALDSNLGPSHQKEELADALHFLIELTILTNCKEVIIDCALQLTIPTVYSYYSWNKIQVLNLPLSRIWIDLAKVGRTCKNKPWKQTEVPIDMLELRTQLKATWESFLFLCQHLFESELELFLYYYRKSKVNHFRIGSKY